MTRNHVCALRKTKRVIAVGMHFLQKTLCRQQRPILLACVSFPLPVRPAHAPSSVKSPSDHTSCLNLFTVFPTCTDLWTSSCHGICPLSFSPGSSFPVTPVVPTNPNYFPFPPHTVFFPMSVLNSCCFPLSDLPFGPGDPFTSTIYWVFYLVQIT